MTIDEFLKFASDLAGTLLPILGVIVFIFLIVFIRHLIVLLKSSNDAIVSLKATLDTANKDLEALDKPLNTLNELSETVDTVHEASKHAVRSALVTLIDNFGAIKDWALHKGKGDDATSCDDQEEA